MLGGYGYQGVQDAVTALNLDQIPCSDLCIVFSTRAQAYYLLWSSEKTEADVIAFAVFVKSGGAKNGTSLPACLLQNGKQAAPPSIEVGSQVEAKYRDQWLVGTGKLLPIDGKYCVQIDSDPDGTLTQAVEVRLISTPSTVTSGSATTSRSVVTSSQASRLRCLPRNITPPARTSASMVAARSDSPIFPNGLRQEHLLEQVPTLEPQVRAVASQSEANRTNHAPRLLSIALAGVKEMTIEELTMEGDVFDPFNPQMKSKLLKRLGFPEEDAILESLDEANSGAFNEGVWTIHNDTSQGLVLKLVDSTRRHTSRPTDAEGYMRLSDICRNIASDHSLSFPVKIFQLRCPSGSRSKDLIVMRRAAGMQLTQILYYKFQKHEIADLLRIFKEFGSFMQTIHRVYRGMQHGDCQPSNVFYDAFNGIFTLIDVADFGYGPFIADGGADDVEHFVEGLKTLSQWYGGQVIADCERQFRQGYSEETRQGY